MNEQPSKSSRRNHSSKRSKIPSRCSSGVSPRCRACAATQSKVQRLSRSAGTRGRARPWTGSGGRASPSRRRPSRPPRRSPHHGRPSSEKLVGRVEQPVTGIRLDRQVCPPYPLQQAPERPEIEVEVLDVEPELAAQLLHALVELHERRAQALDLLLGQPRRRRSAAAPGAPSAGAAARRSSARAARAPSARSRDRRRCGATARCPVAAARREGIEVRRRVRGPCPS